MHHDPHAHPPRRRLTGARVAAATAGAISGLLALGLIVAGGLLLWANAQKDGDGYIATGSDPYVTSTYALATDDLDVGEDSWPLADAYGKIRLEVEPRSDKPVFVGIAPTSSVDSYLERTAHETVMDVDFSPFSADYRRHAGGAPSTPPSEQYFWDAATQGSGTQTLSWDVEDGNWSVVVMNADGSRGIDVGISAGANVPILTAIAWGTLGTGVLLLIVAGGLAYLAIREPRHRPVAPGGTPAVPSPAAA